MTCTVANRAPHHVAGHPQRHGRGVGQRPRHQHPFAENDPVALDRDRQRQFRLIKCRPVAGLWNRSPEPARERPPARPDDGVGHMHEMVAHGQVVPKVDVVGEYAWVSGCGPAEHVGNAWRGRHDRVVRRGLIFLVDLVEPMGDLVAGAAQEHPWDVALPLIGGRAEVGRVPRRVAVVGEARYPLPGHVDLVEHHPPPAAEPGRYEHQMHVPLGVEICAGVTLRLQQRVEGGAVQPPGASGGEHLFGLIPAGTATLTWSVTTVRSHPILAKTVLNHSEPVPDAAGTGSAATEPVSTSISTLARRKNLDTQRMLTVPTSTPFSSTRPPNAGPGGNRMESAEEPGRRRASGSAWPGNCP